MFHSNTERLIDYWRGLAGHGRVPARAAVDPAAFADLAPQVFMLGRVGSGIYPVRLTGGFVSALHQRDLRRQNALSLFAQRDRLNLQTALESARRRPEPLVATVAVPAQGAAIDMEIMFAPLAGADGGPDRFLGLYQPLAMVARLAGQPVELFGVKHLRSTGPANEETPRLRLVAFDGRRIA